MLSHRLCRMCNPRVRHSSHEPFHDTTMPRRPTARSRARSKSNAAPAQAGATPRAEPASRRRRAIWPWAIGGAAVAVAMVLTLIWVLIVKSPSRLDFPAEAAAHAGDWEAALESWRSVNATESATNRHPSGRGAGLPGAQSSGPGRAQLAPSDRRRSDRPRTLEALAGNLASGGPNTRGPAARLGGL